MSLQKNTLSEAAQCDPETDKPTELYHAIARMESTTDRLAKLHSRLCGEDSPLIECGAKQRDVYLFEVLNECPSLIVQHLDTQHSWIGKIERLIFDH